MALVNNKKIILATIIDLNFSLIIYLMLVGFFQLYYQIDFFLKYSWIFYFIYPFFYLTLVIISIGIYGYSIGFYFVRLKFNNYLDINYFKYFSFSVESFQTQIIQLSKNEMDTYRLNGQKQGVVIGGEGLVITAMAKGLHYGLSYFIPNFYHKYLIENSGIFLVFFMNLFFIPLIWGSTPFSLITKNYLISENGKLAPWWKFILRTFITIITIGIFSYLYKNKKEKIYLDDWITKTTFVGLGRRDLLKAINDTSKEKMQSEF